MERAEAGSARLVAAGVRHIDGRVLSRMLPGAASTGIDGVRILLADRTVAERRPYTCWQEARNDLAAGGFLQLPARRCRRCGGRRFDVRDARHGGICGSCSGTGRVRQRSQRALPATLPAEPA